jgi:hypothetical protein
MKKALLIALCLSMAIIAPLQAQFGIGGATEWTQIANHFELALQVSHLINIYRQAVTTFKLAEQQAKHVFSASNYKSVWKTWFEASAPDAYGHNIGYISNINGQLGRLGNSLRTLPSLNDVLGKLHGDTADRIEWQYSEAQLAEGVGAYALDLAGDVHHNDQKEALANLDGIIFSDSDNSNTQTQAAQETAMATAILAHQTEDMKRLTTAIIAQQTMLIKSRHDDLEQAITGQRDWLRRAQAGEMKDYLGDPSGRINNFRE